MENVIIESDNLVSEIENKLARIPKYHEPRKILWESGAVMLQD